MSRLRPAAGWGERDDAPGPVAHREVQREIAPERVSDDVGGGESSQVHRPFELVDEHRVVDRPGQGRTAGVPGERHGEDIVIALELGEDQLPGAPGVGEAVDEEERRTRAAAVQGSEAAHRSPTLPTVAIMAYGL